METDNSKKKLFIIFTILTVVVIAIVSFMLLKYQNEKDTTLPTVSFSTDGSKTTVETISTTVTVTDTGSGVNNDTLKYLWTDSDTKPASTSINNYFKNKTKISSPIGANGNYYLWIYAKDKDGNTTIVGSKAFILKSDKVAKYNNLISYTDKLKIINFFEDNLAFTFSSFKDVNDMNPGTLAHYVYNYSTGPTLTEEELNYINDTYNLSYKYDDGPFIYLPASEVRAYFKDLTGVSLKNMEPLFYPEDGDMVYVSKYDLYLHEAGHGGIGSSPSTYGLNDDGIFWLLNFDNIEQLSDNNYKIDVYNYDVKNSLDDTYLNESGTEDYVQQRLKLFLMDELSSTEVNLVKETFTYREITIKIIGSKIYFVSNALLNL